MADNLKILKQNLDAAIDPTAGVGEILAQEHNDVITEFINKSGRYTGFPFIAVKESDNNVYPPGTFSWNSNGFKKTDTPLVPFTITLSKLTSDLNDIGHILKSISDGSFMRFKDFVGRSALLQFIDYSQSNDADGNIIYSLNVLGVSDNPNYSYQQDEKEPCMIDFFNINSQSDMAEIVTTKSEFVKNKNKVILVLASRNLQPSDNDAILLVKADVDLTLTSLLQLDFSCNIKTKGFICTVLDGTEITYKPNGNQIIADNSGLIFRDGSEFILEF